jgi:hypothetical protein
MPLFPLNPLSHTAPSPRLQTLKQPNQTAVISDACRGADGAQERTTAVLVAAHLAVTQGPRLGPALPRRALKVRERLFVFCCLRRARAR